MVKILKQIWDLYSKIKLYLFIASLIIAFVIGYFQIAPFIESNIYKWITLQMNNSPLLSDILSISDMLTDTLISLSVPMFAFYSGLFIAYKYSNDIEKINTIIKYFSAVTSAPGKFLLFLFSTFTGISTYAYFAGNTETALKIFIFTLILFGLPEGFFLYYAKFKIKKNNLLDNYALHGAFICAVIAIIGYLYGILSEPIKTWLAIKSAYAISH